MQNAHRLLLYVMHRQRVQPHAYDEPIDCSRRSPFARGNHAAEEEFDGAIPRGGACLRCCASLSPTNNLMVDAHTSAAF